MIGAEDVALFSQPSDFSWILELNGECWLVDTGSSGLALCGYCKLRMDRGGYDRRRNTCKGVVRVISETEDETCILGFRNWSGKALNRFVEIKAHYSSVTSLKWISGHHQDGWIDVDAVLRVEGAEMVEFEMYLPEADNRTETKIIDFLYHSDPIASVTLVRGKVNRVAIPTCMAKQDSIELLIECEYAEDVPSNRDARLLGCVVTKVGLIEGAMDPNPL
ncbi:MAG: hypothetical protein AAFY35_18195 [Pseudomonadota bacterium]